MSHLGRNSFTIFNMSEKCIPIHGPSEMPFPTCHPTHAGQEKRVIQITLSEDYSYDEDEDDEVSLSSYVRSVKDEDKKDEILSSYEWAKDHYCSLCGCTPCLIFKHHGGITRIKQDGLRIPQCILDQLDHAWGKYQKLEG